MLIKKSIATPILATFITISPEITMAAEDTMSSILPPIWPFIAIVLFIIFFRKQLNCVPPSTFNPQEETPLSIIEEQLAPEPETPAQTITTDTDTTEAKDNIIDLKDNSQQCQASTAKGTRCKRTTTLEDTSISMDNKSYLLTVCRQHNTDLIIPYSKPLK